MENNKMKTDYIRNIRQRPTSPKCLVFDMDETLCVFDEVKRLRHCEWFEPRLDLVRVAQAAKKHGYDIVIATARPHFCSTGTWNWLKRHNIEASAVYLRNGEVKEYEAAEVKTQMFEDILNKWEVEAFYDDAPKTVQAVQKMGVNAVFVPGNEAYWNSVGG